MKVVFVGSGAFGVPTLRALAVSESHQLMGVITKPPKPAGRGQKPRTTPIFDAAAELGQATLTPNSINDPDSLEWLNQLAPDALVVIAYERLLSRRVLKGRFACNLHASLLPRWRGAAPIHRAVLAADEEIGASVIELAATMDAGNVLAVKKVNRDPMLTTGDWHDLMSTWGPDLILSTLDAYRSGGLSPVAQNAESATHAKKLSKDEGHFAANFSVKLALAQIHGLEPWPRCSAIIDGNRLQFRRATLAEDGPSCVGLVDETGRLRCLDGWIQIQLVQPQSRKSMPFSDFARGLSCSWPQALGNSDLTDS